MTAAPYPADTRAKGWRFELDYEQIEQSSTWSVAKPAARPWLLMMWMLAWKQVPCGSWPADDEVIAGALGIDDEQWALHRKALMRGWAPADDGRLYHPTITKRVIEMLGKRRSDSDRQAAKRAREAADTAVRHPVVTGDKQVTPVVVGSESSTDNRPPTTPLQDKPVGIRRGKRATPLPVGFGISDRVRTWAAAKGLNHLDQQLEALVSYAKRKGATYVDWDEALMTAVRDDWAKVGKQAKDDVFAGAR